MTVSGLRVAQIRMVREIENLRTELQPLGAAHREVLEERDVPLLLSWIVEEIAFGVAEGSRRRRGETPPG